MSRKFITLTSTGPERTPLLVNVDHIVSVGNGSGARYVNTTQADGEFAVTETFAQIKDLLADRPLHRSIG